TENTSKKIPLLSAGFKKLLYNRQMPRKVSPSSSVSKTNTKNIISAYIQTPLLKLLSLCLIDIFPEGFSQIKRSIFLMKLAQKPVFRLCTNLPTLQNSRRK